MEIVHLKTEIATLFGVLEDGNIIKEVLLKTDGQDALTVRKLSKESLQVALEAIEKIKAELQERCNN